MTFVYKYSLVCWIWQSIWRRCLTATRTRGLLCVCHLNL